MMDAISYILNSFRHCSIARFLFIFASINFLLVNIASAQDIHFSQSFNTPLSLNPALTGKVDGTFRVGIDYRNQWIGLVKGRNSFSTPSLYGDAPIRFKSGSILGVGLNLINDKSSGGRLSSFSGIVSTAYHQAIGSSKDHFFSFGLQFGLLHKKLDLADIRLADQIDLQNKSVINASTDFNNLKGSDGGFDLNVGFDWSSKFSERASMHLGYAVFHVTQPSISFYMDEQKLPARHALNLGADFGITDHFRLLPFFLYMTQAKANQTNVGLRLDFPFTSESGMQLGTYLRIDDAVIPYFGFDIKGFRLGASYDIPVSSLQKTSGGFEISLTYTGRYIAVPEVKPALYCPRF